MGQPGQDSRLNLINILVFIHQDFLEEVLVVDSRWTGMAVATLLVVGGQNIQGQVLQVIIVNHCLVRFILG